MKVFVVFACLAALAAAYPQDHGRIFNKSPALRAEVDLAPIKELFDKFVAFLKNYDPIHIESKTVFDMFGMHLKVKNLHAEGFSNIISDLSVDIGFPETKVHFELDLPEISGSIESFDANTPIIFGQGSASFSLKNGKISISIAYNLLQGLRPTVAVTSVESANVEIVGLNNDPEMSQAISSAANNFLNNVINSPTTHQIIANAIDIAINAILGMKN